MTLDQLRYFCAVCTYEGVTRAAQALNVSQPSVTAAIKNLETEFGVTLFNRQHKRLTLTPAGQQLFEKSRPLLQNAQALSSTMLALRTDHKPIRLGVPPMIGSLVLPKLFSKFDLKYPQLQVVEDDNSGLRKLLETGQIHMALLPHTQSFDSSLCTVPLTQLENICCVSKHHPLAGVKTLRLEQLQNEPLVLFKNSFFQTERLLNGFHALGIQPHIILYTGQLSTVQNMIAENAAVGFMFAFLTKGSDSVVGIPLEPSMATDVSLVWRKDAELSDTMKTLIRFVQEEDFHV